MLAQWQNCQTMHFSERITVITQRMTVFNRFEKVFAAEVEGRINLLVLEFFFFLILAHPVYKMWIIQEPNTLELWNKLHFEEKKLESKCHV